MRCKQKEVAVCCKDGKPQGDAQVKKILQDSKACDEKDAAKLQKALKAAAEKLSKPAAGTDAAQTETAPASGSTPATAGSPPAAQLEVVEDVSAAGKSTVRREMVRRVQDENSADVVSKQSADAGAPPANKKASQLEVAVTGEQALVGEAGAAGWPPKWFPEWLGGADRKKLESLATARHKAYLECEEAAKPVRHGRYELEPWMDAWGINTVEDLRKWKRETLRKKHQAYRQAKKAYCDEAHHEDSMDHANCLFGGFDNDPYCGYDTR